MPRGIPYTKEFREQAVDRALETSVDDASKELEVNKRTLLNWITKSGKGPSLIETRRLNAESLRVAREERWERILDKLYVELESALDDMRSPFTKTIVDQKGYEHEITQNPEPADRAKLATVVGILTDKIQGKTGAQVNVSQNNLSITVSPPDLQALKAQNQRNEEIRNALVVETREVEQ
jgi:transposase-like protein